MAKRRSLEEQADILEREELRSNCEKGKRWARLNEARQAFEAMERIYKLELEELRLNCEAVEKWTQFTEARQAFEAIERIYKRSKKEWAYAQRAHIKTERKYAKVMKQLKDAGESTQGAAARKRGSLDA